jgi:predicted transglutaminase-like cysteine proteinase
MRQVVFAGIRARLADDSGRLAAIVALAAAQFLIHGIQTNAQAAPLPQSQHPIQGTGTATPIAAWTKFCEQFPTECAINLEEPARIKLTRQTWRTIVAVNTQVNTRVKSKTDREHWGVADRWDFPDDGYGDCEDYQILKRRLLVKAGLPQRALRMTVVIDELGAGHAVMMVRTDRGDYILDNKRNAVLPWYDTGYIYVKREGSEGSSWTSLGGRTSPTITANQ